MRSVKNWPEVRNPSPTCETLARAGVTIAGRILIMVSKRDRSALGALQPAQVEINTNNMTVRNHLGETSRYRPGATAAIEDRRARTDVRYEETRVDVRAAQLYRSL